jgi:hypothetical protein
MAKRKFKLSEKEANELLSAYQQTKDGPTRTRYQAVRLYGLGYPEAIEFAKKHGINIPIC